jgi:hypothetical protein
VNETEGGGGGWRMIDGYLSYLATSYIARESCAYNIICKDQSNILIWMRWFEELSLQILES